MQNVGTWDSDFAVFLFLMMMLPIFINAIGKMINSLGSSEDTTDSTQEQASEFINSYNQRNNNTSDVSPNVARLDNTAMVIIQAELKSIKSKLHSGASRPKPKLKPKLKPQKKPKPRPRPERKSVPHKDSRRKTVINPKEKEMQQEASNALNTLGIKKSKANSIVKDLCKDKVYSSSEDLIKDAIVYI